jgi:Ca2+-dependent lipid-binding protein
MTLRLYVIRGLSLMAQDDDGFSDPFLNVHLTNHDSVYDKDRTLRNKTLKPNW